MGCDEGLILLRLAFAYGDLNLTGPATPDGHERCNQLRGEKEQTDTDHQGNLSSFSVGSHGSDRNPNPVVGEILRLR